MIKSSTWINNLRMEMEMLQPEDYIEPEWVMKDKEEVVGEMPDDIKRLFTLYRGYQKLAAQAQVESQFASPSKRPEAVGLTRQYIHKTDVLSSLLWYSINEYFNLWEHPQVGIRKGWKVTYSDEEMPPPGMMGFQFRGQM